MDLIKDIFPSLDSEAGSSAAWEPLSLERWESRIVPVLLETESRDGRAKKKFVLDGKDLFYAGNDAALEAFLARKTAEASGSGPSFYLYAFAGLQERHLLRRLKDFPDEASREELEAPWKAYCEEEKSMVWVNAGPAEGGIQP